MSAVSLSAQLTELRTLLEEHSLIIDKTVARGRLGEREAAFRKDRLRAAIATMEWLQTNELGIKRSLRDSTDGRRP